MDEEGVPEAVHHEEARGALVLVVEDSDTQAAFLKKALAHGGYRVAAARDGAEGLKAARLMRPAVILSDVMMPVMDGYSMCREIKRDDTLKGIPVALITQLDGPEDILNGLDSGADSFIIKPFKPEYLASRVATLIDGPPGYSAGADGSATDVLYGGRRYSIRAGLEQTLNFLIAAYENSLQQKGELNRAEEHLRQLNERLEDRVRERTAALTSESEERLSAERSLLQSEEIFRGILDAANDAVVCLEPSGKVYLWNRKAEEMFGLRSNEAVGRPIYDLIAPERLREEVRAGIEGFLAAAMAGYRGGPVEFVLKGSGGAEFAAELSVSAHRVSGAWHSIGIIRDITRHKGVERDLKAGLDELEHMKRLLAGKEMEAEVLVKEIKTLKQRVAGPESQAGRRGA
jgi:PAS domain S-box-containing protein